MYLSSLHNKNGQTDSKVPNKNSKKRPAPNRNRLEEKKTGQVERVQSHRVRPVYAGPQHVPFYQTGRSKAMETTITENKELGSNK